MDDKKEKRGFWSVLDRHSDGILAVGVGLVAFVLYWLTLCRHVHWFDSAELSAAAATLGIPHPPGYPVYTLVGRLFVAVLPVEPAYAVNLMSAFFGGVSVGLLYTAARQLKSGPVAGLAGSATLAGAPLFWKQAVVAEVYTPGLAFLLLTLVLLVRGHRKDDARYTVAAAAVAGVGLGAHLFLATCGLGFALIAVSQGLTIKRLPELKRLATGGQWRRRLLTGAACLLATGLGSLVFLYLLFRARSKPAVNFGDPATLGALWQLVSGGHFKQWFQLTGSVSPGSVAWVLYNQLFVVGVGLAAVGLWRLLRRQALFAVALLLMAAGNVWYFYNYKPPDWEVFYLPTLCVLCLLVAAGAQAVIDVVQRLHGRLGPVAGWGARGAVLLFPLVMITMTYPSVDMSRQAEAKQYGEALGKQLPPKAILLHFSTFEEWRYHTVFGLYYRKVLGKRPDVAIVQNPRWLHLRSWISQRPLYFYVPPKRWRSRLVLRREGELWRVVRLNRRTRGTAKQPGLRFIRLPGPKRPQ